MGPVATMERLEAVEGCLLGVCVGDALGLPYEGLSPARASALARLPQRPRHRMILGRGLVSDDTDHAVFCAQALLISQGDAPVFSKELKRRLRWWAATLPAGAGMATLRASLKMWAGLSRTAVYSAGNGAAMRAPILGAALCDDDAARRAVVEASTLATHGDPRALASARAIAELCARGARGEYGQEAPSPQSVEEGMVCGVDEPSWLAAAAEVRGLLERGASDEEALSRFGGAGGASGFCMHSVPMAIFLWARHWRDAQGAMSAAIGAGGDVDTVCAMLGGLAGAAWGRSALPMDWVEGVADWPHGPAKLSRLARALCGAEPAAGVGFSWWLFARSPLFLAWVMGQALRRAFPPYAKRPRGEGG